MSYRASLMIKHLGQCIYCRADICYAEATTDHFIPRRHGGKNCATNRVLACQPCNSAKADLNPTSFGIWHPDDISPEGQRGLLLLRRQIIQRQLSTLRQRRKTSMKCSVKRTKEPLATVVAISLTANGAENLAETSPMHDSTTIKPHDAEDEK